ncbi:DUF4349 domain-containing protein [Asticcacaulis solisilvae]|uniref:DUF4349 domain-containing protein n=1 Tax=Asticcacaulis solisilvae TaxID=1217274 RepID=UPI003FD8C09B
MKSHANLVLIMALAALPACSKPATITEDKYADEKVNVDLVAPPPPPAATGAAAPASPEAMSGAPQLAYDYTYGFQASAKGIEALRQSDQAACAQAGPAECQMLASTSDSNRDADVINKSLELRVSPAWLKHWQGGLEASVSKAHARITQDSVSSEDLSLQIVDVSARLKNKLALRDRLQEIIRTSNGKIADLVEAENQLSQVQSDIDSTQSQLAVMQKRVATVHLSLNYHSEAAATSGSVFAPVSAAWNGVLRNMLLMVSVLITVAAFLVPIAIIAVPVAWWFLKRRKAKAPVKD